MVSGVGGRWVSSVVGVVTSVGGGGEWCGGGG